jgi:hypothetical protein
MDEPNPDLPRYLGADFRRETLESLQELNRDYYLQCCRDGRIPMARFAMLFGASAAQETER